MAGSAVVIWEYTSGIEELPHKAVGTSACTYGNACRAITQRNESMVDTGKIELTATCTESLKTALRAPATGRALKK